MRLFKRKQRGPAAKTCTRKTCCTDSPGSETTVSCFNIGACGCQVVAHPAHPTPAFVTQERLIDPPQPPIGGTCDTCGHFAARHDEDGCHFDRPNPKPDCDCTVMRWVDHEWPRPWLSAPDGLHPIGAKHQS